MLSSSTFLSWHNLLSAVFVIQLLCSNAFAAPTPVPSPGLTNFWKKTNPANVLIKSGERDFEEAVKQWEILSDRTSKLASRNLWPGGKRSAIKMEETGHWVYRQWTAKQTEDYEGASIALTNLRPMLENTILEARQLALDQERNLRPDVREKLLKKARKWEILLGLTLKQPHEQYPAHRVELSLDRPQDLPEAKQWLEKKLSEVQHLKRHGVEMPAQQEEAQHEEHQEEDHHHQYLDRDTSEGHILRNNDLTINFAQPSNYAHQQGGRFGPSLVPENRAVEHRRPGGRGQQGGQRRRFIVS